MVCPTLIFLREGGWSPLFWYSPPLVMNVMKLMEWDPQAWCQLLRNQIHNINQQSQIWHFSTHNQI